MKYKVDRNKWSRGELNGPTSLQNEMGFRCCLGFVAIQDGFSEDDIIEIGEPGELAREQVYDVETALGEAVFCESRGGYYFAESSLVSPAININDRVGVSEFWREYQLRRLFAEHGLAMEFYS